MIKGFLHCAIAALFSVSCLECAANERIIVQTIDYSKMTPYYNHSLSDLCFEFLMSEAGQRSSRDSSNIRREFRDRAVDSDFCWRSEIGVDVARMIQEDRALRQAIRDDIRLRRTLERLEDEVGKMRRDIEFDKIRRIGR
jgi:hypothetical protein